jgi:hypothetical protein
MVAQFLDDAITSNKRLHAVADELMADGFVVVGGTWNRTKKEFRLH